MGLQPKCNLKPGLIFVSSLITYIFHFKYISAAHISTKFSCKPADNYTYYTKIHVLTQGLLSSATGCPRSAFFLRSLCLFFKYLSSFILLGLYPLGMLLNIQGFKSMSGVLLCKSIHLSAALVWVSLSEELDKIPVHSLQIAVTTPQIDVRQN